MDNNKIGTSLEVQQKSICLPMQQTQFQYLGQEDSLEKETATHSSNSCLGNPMDREDYSPWDHR